MTQQENGRVEVIGSDHWGPNLGLVIGEGSFVEIVGPSVGAVARSLYRVELVAGASTRPLRHSGEAVYYVESGTAALIDADHDGEQSLIEGSMIHVHAGTTYVFRATDEAVLLGGPCPVDADLSAVAERGPSAGASEREGSDSGRLRVFHRDQPGLMVPFISNDARLVIWLGSGAFTANMNYVVLEPGERNKEHVHRYSEDTIHILSGSGTAEDLTNDLRLRVGPGDTIHIPPGVWHAVAADRGETLISIGGPCPADLDMLAAVGVEVNSHVEDIDEYVATVGVPVGGASGNDAVGTS